MEECRPQGHEPPEAVGRGTEGPETSTPLTAPTCPRGAPVAKQGVTATGGQGTTSGVTT